MTTRNYKLSEQNTKQINLSKVYKTFKEDYKENLTHDDIILGPSYGISIYDINNTAVIQASRMGLLVPRKGVGKDNYGNLRIIGLEKNIKMTEEEIKLKGFILEQLR
jgi:hypothetical protein